MQKSSAHTKHRNATFLAAVIRKQIFTAMHQKRFVSSVCEFLTCKRFCCRNFKDRIQKQSKKDEKKWRILVKKTLRAKSITGAPFFSLEAQMGSSS